MLLFGLFQEEFNPVIMRPVLSFPLHFKRKEQDYILRRFFVVLYISPGLSHSIPSH